MKKILQYIFPVVIIFTACFHKKASVAKTEKTKTPSVYNKYVPLVADAAAPQPVAPTVAAPSAKALETKPVEALPQNVVKAMAKFPNYSMTDYEKGKEVYKAKCFSCHDAKGAKNTEEDWRIIVPNMAAMMKEAKKPIDAKEEELILNYLIARGL